VVLSTQFRTTGEKKLWVHPLNQKRITHNVIVSFICEIRSDEKKFKNYTRVGISTQDYIIQQIGEEIRKEDTNFRRSISPEERLLITLK